MSQDSFVILQGNKKKNVSVNPTQTKYAYGLSMYAVEEAKK